MRRFVLLLTIVLVGAHRAGAQQVLFTSFGPGDAYGVPGLSVGWGQAWLLAGNNGAICAMAFTPQVASPFWRVDFPLRYGEPAGSLSNGGMTNFFGPPNLDVALTEDNSGRPGTVLEQFHLSNVLNGQFASGVVSVFSMAHPMLHAGVQYWMVLSTPDLLNTAFTWNLGPDGLASTTYTEQVLSEVTSLAGWDGVTFPQGARPGMAVFGGSASAFPVPTIAAGGIGSAASYAATNVVTAGSWMSIYGSDLAQTTRGWEASDFPGDGTLPKTLDGVSVLVNGEPAAISYVSPGQLNVLIPDFEEYQQFPVGIQVITQGGASVPVPVTVGFCAPALFASQQGGKSYAAATFVDGSLVTITNPAKPGDVVVLYGTGFGASDPAIASGVVVLTPQPLSMVSTLSVAVGGVPASVLYAGITGAGLDQINVVIPEVAAGNQEVVATYLSLMTQGGVVLPIRAR